DEVFKENQDVGEDDYVSSLHLFFGNMDLPPSSYHDSLEKLWDEEEEPEEVETVMKVVASVYHHKLEGSLPPVGVIYSLSNQESDTLRAYISENVEKGFILPSSPSTGAPGLLAKGRMVASICVLTTTQSMLIDLHGAYNLLRLKEGDDHLTAFRTKYGSYEYLVMPFGLTNAPASLQNLVNDIFYDLLDIYVMVYLDDIMVFSKSEEENVTHVSTVLSRLRANAHFAKASKCLFHVSSVKYLGYIVSSEGLKMDQEKFQQILNWPPPRNLKALQSFIGFGNLYHHFIKNYSKKISSLSSFLKQDSCCPLNEEAFSQFHQLEGAFTIAPILLYPPLWRPMHLIMPWVLY
ncbi:hypothetical protein O181_091248, partial [Austropuccinia psidii MF-1]|nr:hypothetical protein [Austropuccinia psidii MF-1]